MTDDNLRPVTVTKKTDEAHNIVSYELVETTAGTSRFLRGVAY